MLPDAAYKFFSEHVLDQIQTTNDILAKSADQEDYVLIFQGIFAAICAGPMDDASMFIIRSAAITEIMNNIFVQIPNLDAQNEALIITVLGHYTPIDLGSGHSNWYNITQIMAPYHESFL